MKKTHPICDAMTTKLELPTSEHPLKCSERKEGEEETTNTRKKERQTAKYCLIYCVCICGGKTRATTEPNAVSIYWKTYRERKKTPKLEMIKKLSTWKSISNVEYLIFETRLCVEITKFQSELTKLQRTERCETQNIQRQFSFPSTNLFVTVAERQQNTTTTQKKRRWEETETRLRCLCFFWGLSSSSSLSIWPRQVMTKHNAFSVCVAITQDTHTRTVTHT